MRNFIHATTPILSINEHSIMYFDYPFRPIISFTRILNRAKPKHLAWGRVLIGYLKLLFFEPFRWMEGVWTLISNVRNTQVDRPVFILGHWRSGTTHLQTLIAAHPSFASMNVFQAVFPDQFALTESWLKPVLRVIARWINYQNHFHQRPLDWDEAQEEDLALASMPVSETPYWARSLGRSHSLRNIDPQARMRVHKRFVQKLQRKNPGKRLVLKSPPNLLFLPELITAYPDARFIFIYRDAIEVYHSMQKLWRATFDTFAFCTLSVEEVHAAIIEDFAELMAAYQRFRDSSSAERLIEVDYHQLQRTESSEMEKIWAFLEEHPPATPANSTFYVPHTYQSSVDLVEELKTKWAPYLWPTAR
ncbi:MAG: sulfotransferase [Bacteroidia bacterium]|nr:sulfotransferase [Bacteroidia bacterium]